jgi:hypothetical protein
MQREELQIKGSNVIIADLVDGQEYQERFGEDKLPPGSDAGILARLLKRLKLP